MNSFFNIQPLYYKKNINQEYIKKTCNYKKYSWYGKLFYNYIMPYKLAFMYKNNLFDKLSTILYYQKYNTNDQMFVTNPIDQYKNLDTHIFLLCMTRLLNEKVMFKHKHQL